MSTNYDAFASWARNRLETPYDDFRQKYDSLSAFINFYLPNFLDSYTEFEQHFLRIASKLITDKHEAIIYIHSLHPALLNKMIGLISNFVPTEIDEPQDYPAYLKQLFALRIALILLAYNNIFQPKSDDAYYISSDSLVGYYTDFAEQTFDKETLSKELHELSDKLKEAQQQNFTSANIASHAEIVTERLENVLENVDEHFEDRSKEVATAFIDFRTRKQKEMYHSLYGAAVSAIFLTLCLLVSFATGVWKIDTISSSLAELTNAGKEISLYQSSYNETLLASDTSISGTSSYDLSSIEPTDFIKEHVKVISKATDSLHDASLYLPLIFERTGYLFFGMLLLYILRLFLRNYYTARAELLQLDLRETLCKYAPAYKAFMGSEANLDEFSKHIFSPLNYTSVSAPHPIDGVEKLLKAMPWPKKESEPAATKGKQA